MSDYHAPVMLDEATRALQAEPGDVILDATLGGGGYAAALLERVSPGGLVIGMDRDEAALTEATARLATWGDAFRPVRGNFADLATLLAAEGCPTLTGVVFDLGVSSHQLNEASRGFSFRANAPLDMRMDRSQGETAADLVATRSAADLTRILREFGEEKWAARIALFLVEARARHPVATTGDLVRVVEAAVPKAARPNDIHVATRTFQALRIAVNDELDALSRGLDAALSLLAPGGRLVVLSYHSLEDRIVKRRFREWERPCICPPNLPVCGCGRVPLAKSLTHGAEKPSAEEVALNPRARSARLRAVAKLDPV